MMARIGMHKLNRFIQVIILPSLLLIMACGSDEEDPVVPDVFRGIYQSGDSNVVGGVKLDSVELSIMPPGRYTLHHWDYGNRQVEFCDSEGSILGFGTPVYKFLPSKYTTTNCDSLNGANRGIFEVTYRRDSMWLAHPADSGDNNIYEFELVRIR